MAHSRLVPVVTALLLVAAALAGVAPVGAAQESASVGDYTVTRGETVSISVGHSAPANLTVSGGGFEVVVALGGSGGSNVQFDTYRSTSPNANDFITGGSASLTGEPISEAVKPGEYTLEVTIDGKPEAYGTLTVTPNGELTSETGALSGDTEPGSAGVGAVQTHEEIGRENDNVVVSDYAAFVVDENDSGYGAPFGGGVSFDALSAEGFEARVTELDPEPNTATEEYTVEDFDIVGQLGAGGDRFAVLWNTSGVDLGTGSNHTYGFELTVDATRNPLFSENRTLLTERVTLVEPSMSISADPGYTLAPWDGDRMEISGETNRLPGTRLEVRALDEDADRPRLWKGDVRVSSNGTFGTTLDFADADRPASFPLWVRGYEDETRQTVRLTAANASLLFPSQTVANGSVTVERLTLSEGGFLRLTANNTTVGESELLGVQTNASVDVALNGTLDGPTNVTATALADENGNGALDADDPAYVADGAAVADTGLVEPTTEPAPVNNTTTAPTTARPTTAQQTTLRVNDESEPLAPVANNDGSSGGFVPLSPVTTLLALAAAALLALRRGPDRL